MPEIEAQGASLVAISPQLPEWSGKIAKKHDLTFDVLSDHGNAYARSWNIVFTVDGDLRGVYSKFGIDLPKYNGEPSWTLPMPTRAVITPDGRIVSLDTNPDYTRRPEPAETIAVLESL